MHILATHPDPMSEPSPHSADASRQRVDVNTLTLSQLQKLASKGSRRARAELERRLLASGEPSRPAALPSRPSDLPSRPANLPPPRPAQPASGAAARPRAAARPAPAPMPAPAPGADGAGGDAKDVLVRQLEMIARQERERDSADGAPRMVGMVMIGFAALVLLGGLVTLGYRAGGGLFYIFCALGIAAVGWLLMRCSRWALALHPVLILLALAWAWAAGGAAKSFLAALIQSAPLWLPALWMIAPPVREPLE